MLAVAQNIPMTYYSMPNTTDSPFYDWIVEVNSNTSPPLVHSVSYGELENVADSTTNNARVDAEFAKAAARGLTIMVASGDDGVANFAARTDATQCGFNPSFPATSSWVLAVGATQFKSGLAGHPEIAQLSSNTPPGGITTGGGFSSQFSRPKYQDEAVNNYLQSAKLPDVPTTSSELPSAGFNIAGRGYPDVAALGHNYPVVLGGKVYQVDGTSAASPVCTHASTLCSFDIMS